MNNISYICGVTFAPFVPAGSFSQERARQSLRTMKEQCQFHHSCTERVKGNATVRRDLLYFCSDNDR